MQNISTKMVNEINKEYLNKLFEYNPITGIFIRLTSAGNQVVGSIAGRTHHSGYIEIELNRKKYRAHRLAWLYVYGKFPDKFIDHINGVKADNRICNLREATPQENARNRKIKINNTSGYKGVSYYKNLNKWGAHIMVSGSLIYLGIYTTPEEASEIYENSAKKYFGEFYKDNLKG